MKIEMGESLIYSWLRHEKQCKVVQTNWKVSPNWNLMHKNDLDKVMYEVETHFKTSYCHSVFENNVSLEQVLKQGEIDAIGISFSGRKRELYAVDIAFHELGLRYGSKEETAIRVVKKCVRSAMCLYGYMDYKNAKIIFSSPKINKTPNDLINKYINDAQNLMNRLGYKFTFEVIANDDFETKILDPVLNVSNDVADTSEMFLRSYQLVQMFK